MKMMCLQMPVLLFNPKGLQASSTWVLFGGQSPISALMNRDLAWSQQCGTIVSCGRAKGLWSKSACKRGVREVYLALD
eukprot:4074462-Amphidinium_carterae.1